MTGRPPTEPCRRAALQARRGALKAVVMVGGAAYAGALGVPAVVYLAGGGVSGGGLKDRWIRVAPLGELAESAPMRVEVVGDNRDAFTVTRRQNLGSIWLQKRDDELIALSAECPHLGCAVELGGDAKSFSCPCHTSRFTLAGKVDSGPSPRALDQLATRVVDGWVEIDFRRYRQAVDEKVEVG